jgi:hypothetical protein
MVEKGRDAVYSIHDVFGDEYKSSVKLTQTSRGVNWEIKVYDENPKRALESADQLFAECKKKYGILLEPSG